MEPHLCPSCRKPLAPDVPMGLCPECLIKAGFPTGTGTETGATTKSFVPPAIEDIAKLFPQLEILELIGRGGMGAVYKARQKQLNRFVALKILPPGIGSDPAFAERFTREARALAQLNHPNIVTLYEFGETSGQFYFLMEFVDGVNLRQLLNTSRVAPREALAIVPQICDALQFAHDQGIVHRDIKPENILLDRRGRVKVADFGLAKLMGTGDEPAVGATAAGSSSLTDAGKIMGTPNYMSPEQKENPGDVDHRADIYALGVVFYQMLTGELPGQRIESPSKKVHIDVRLDEIVLRALEKKPELRYQQASVLKTELETIVADTSEIGNANKTKSEVAPRFSRTAIVGAVFSVIGIVALPFLVTLLFQLPGDLERINRAWAITRCSMVFFMTIAPLFTGALLGWVAVTQIQRSSGKLSGFALAAFETIFFTLLVLDALIWFLAAKVFPRWIPLGAYEGFKIFAVAIAISLIVDFLIVWVIRRALSKVRASRQPARSPSTILMPAFLVNVFTPALLISLFVNYAVGQFTLQNENRIVVINKDFESLKQKGWEAWAAHRYAEAAEDFRTMIQHSPDSEEAWAGLCWCTYECGNIDEAERACKKTLTLNPNEWLAWITLTRIYLLNGDFDNALIYATKSVDSQQAHGLALRMLAAAKARKLDPDLRKDIQPAGPEPVVASQTVPPKDWLAIQPVGGWIADAEGNDAKLQPMAKQALSEIGTNIFPTIFAYLDDPTNQDNDANTRRFDMTRAVEFIGVNASAGIPKFTAMLKSSHQETAYSGAVGLAYSSPAVPEALAILTNALTDPAPGIRDAGTYGIGLSLTFETNDPAQSALPLIIKNITDPLDYIRSDSAVALVSFTQHQCQRSAFYRMKPESNGVPDFVISAMIKLFSDKSHYARYYALSGLNNSCLAQRIKPYLPEIRKMTNDASGDVRGAARSLLEEINNNNSQTHVLTKPPPADSQTLITAFESIRFTNNTHTFELSIQTNVVSANCFDATHHTSAALGPDWYPSGNWFVCIEGARAQVESSSTLHLWAYDGGEGLWEINISEDAAGWISLAQLRDKPPSVVVQLLPDSVKKLLP